MLECSKATKGGSIAILRKYGPGEAFGELALLYNMPRAATIIAKSASVLWTLDRATFNHIVRDVAIKKREKYEEFLKKVTILAHMDDYERAQIADSLREVSFGAGTYIIKEGETKVLQPLPRAKRRSCLITVAIISVSLLSSIVSQGQPMSWLGPRDANVSS